MMVRTVRAFVTTDRDGRVDIPAGVYEATGIEDGRAIIHLPRPHRQPLHVRLEIGDFEALS